MSPKSDPTFVKSGLLLTKDLKLNIKNQDKKDAKLKFLKNPVTKENPAIVLSEFNENYVKKQPSSEIHHSNPTLAPLQKFSQKI